MKRKSSSIPSSGGVFSVVLVAEGLDRLFEAVSFLGAAWARGDQGILFLRGPALAAFVLRKWPVPSMMSEEMLRFQHKSPDEFLEGLRAAGGVWVYACSAWATMWKLSPATVASRVDAVVGLNAFLSQSQGGPVLTF